MEILKNVADAMGVSKVFKEQMMATPEQPSTSTQPSPRRGREEEVKVAQLIVFHLGDEEFAARIAEVREIIKAGTITPIPDAPEFIRGIINVRGDIVVTIDPKVLFSLNEKEVACKPTP